MKYHSTRNNEGLFDSADAIIAGICNDGGLFVPQSFPSLDVATLIHQPYSHVAAKVLGLYLTDYSNEFIEQIVEKVYSEQRFENGAGHLKRVSGRLCFLELWHGPTCAFKDYALQLLAPLLCEAKRMKNDITKSLVLVATSGDTGSAALYGFAEVEGTNVVVFYPNGGVSMVQERQMVDANGDNLKVFAVNGNFDDIQTAVKKVFVDSDMAQIASENGVKLSSANSINLGRLLPQVCYYFSSYAEMLGEGLLKMGETVDFVVPTGNFGDILAGYYAKQMGLPIGKLICASNKNRILTDFFETGIYDANREFYLTGSPSMDILISSNLERLLYHESGDAKYVATLMNDLKTTGRFEISKELLNKLNETIYSASADDEQAAKAILDAENKYQYLCDTHTAVALSAANSWNSTGKSANQVVVLSTASPYKFPSEVVKAVTNNKLTDKIALETMRECYPWLEIPKGIKNVLNSSSNKADVVEIADIAKTVDELIKER